MLKVFSDSRLKVLREGLDLNCQADQGGTRLVFAGFKLGTNLFGLFLNGLEGLH